MRRIGSNISDIELDVPEELRPSALRRMGFTPELDARIDQMAPPRGSFLTGLAVACLRAYRKLRPQSIGNRCVFEPSCSRYSELAFRTRSAPEAFRLTVHRLGQCRPGNGGLNLTGVEIPE